MPKMIVRRRILQCLIAIAVSVTALAVAVRDGAVHAQSPSSIPACGIGLKLLVVSADGSEVALQAIESTLQYLGTPYTLHIAAQNPNALTPQSLMDGCRARYNGIILTTASLGYSPDGGATWTSALTPAEFQALESYERTYGIRRVSWFTFPTPDVGFQWGVGVDTSATPIPVKLTSAGQSVFSYIAGGAPLVIGGKPLGLGGLLNLVPLLLNGPSPEPNPLEIRNAFSYLAKPLDPATQPLLIDASGNALMAVRSYPDGRSHLAMTFDSNPHLLHSRLFAYGVINWVTSGLFIGERKIYMSPQIDDVFIPNKRWTSSTPCGTPVSQTAQELRITATDFTAVQLWQTAKRLQPTTADLRLTMVFNGVGAERLLDGLTLTARLNQSNFYWVNHTYDHDNLDAVDGVKATWEIVENNRVARALGLSRWQAANMVTPEISGLTNPAFLNAAYAAGIRTLVSDTSRAGYANPSPNAGLYNAVDPRLFMIPRRPNNLFFNVGTPSDWTSEYNCMYEAFWKRKLSYEEILEFESQQLLGYMLQGDIDPWMFHQTNLKVHALGRTLLTDLLDLTLEKYKAFFKLPVLSPAMEQIAVRMKEQMALGASQVSAIRYPGSLAVSAASPVVVPVTGANLPGAESYGGQKIGRITVKAGQTVTVPLP